MQTGVFVMCDTWLDIDRVCSSFPPSPPLKTLSETHKETKCSLTYLGRSFRTENRRQTVLAAPKLSTVEMSHSYAANTLIGCTSFSVPLSILPIKVEMPMKLFGFWSWFKDKQRGLTWHRSIFHNFLPSGHSQNARLGTMTLTIALYI